ncbi:MAG: endonuclease domain-containing protein [Ginsengibacter sp.]
MENKKKLNSNSHVSLLGEEPSGLGLGGCKMFYESAPIIFANAKKLRNEPTPSEIIFWSLLKQHFSGTRFKRQHPISQYVADFYCHKFKLVIEIDGDVRLSEEAKANDKLRDEHMQSLGVEIIRFPNEEVCKNGEAVVKKLKELIERQHH